MFSSRELSNFMTAWAGKISITAVHAAEMYVVVVVVVEILLFLYYN